MVIIITAACARVFRVRPVGRSAGRPVAQNVPPVVFRARGIYSVAAAVTYSARVGPSPPHFQARRVPIIVPARIVRRVRPASPSTFEANPRPGGRGRFLSSDARGLKPISDKKVSHARHAFFHRPRKCVPKAVSGNNFRGGPKYVYCRFTEFRF